MPFLTTEFGNPSGAHRLARDANRAVDESREVVAEALGVLPGELVFTGGGTEADNLAVLGAIEARPGLVVCSAIEHHAVLDPCEKLGAALAPVDSRGLIDLDRLEELLDSETSLVSIMLANNETGIVQPFHEIAAIVRKQAPNALLHTDAVQALAWLDVAALAADADLISVSAHKVGGTQGVGALAIREPAKLAARAIGGGQERGRRSGTQNVAGIVAMAAAVEELVVTRDSEVLRVERLRDQIRDGVLATIPEVIYTGDDVTRTANIAHFCVRDVESESMLFLLERSDVFASAASSCSSGAMEPSHVLQAMGVDPKLGLGSLRLSLGHTSTQADVDAVLTALPQAVDRLRTSQENQNG